MKGFKFISQKTAVTNPYATTLPISVFGHLQKENPIHFPGSDITADFLSQIAKEIEAASRLQPQQTHQLIYIATGERSGRIMARLPIIPNSITGADIQMQYDE